MPNIFIQTFEGRTIEEKRNLAKRITEVVVEEFKVDPEVVNIRFINVKKEDLARGGRLLIDK